MGNGTVQEGTKAPLAWSREGDGYKVPPAFSKSAYRVTCRDGSMFNPNRKLICDSEKIPRTAGLPVSGSRSSTSACGDRPVARSR